MALVLALKKFTAPNIIPEKEYNQRLIELMNYLEKTHKCESQQQLDELYILHNDKYQKEDCKTCNSKRSRVFKTMLNHYKSIIQK